MRRKSVTSKLPILLWIFTFGVCGAVGYLIDAVWMMVIGGVGILFYIYMWRYNVTPLHLAIEQWETSDVEQLILDGARINAKDKGGNTPLHIAARCNRSVIAKMLLNAGANVNVKNKVGNTPLHWTAVHNACEAAETLISWGADVNLKNKTGLKPLDRAINMEHSEVTNIFLQCENANAEDSLG